MRQQLRSRDRVEKQNELAPGTARGKVLETLGFQAALLVTFGAVAKSHPLPQERNQLQKHRSLPLIRPSVRTGAPSPKGEGLGGYDG